MATISIGIPDDPGANPALSIAAIDAGLAELYALRRQLEVIATTATEVAEQEARLQAALTELPVSLERLRPLPKEEVV